MRAFASLLALGGLVFVLYGVWPHAAIDALLNDPEATLRAPWDDEAPPETAQATIQRSEQPEEPSEPAQPGLPALRVLFVGNSHTHQSDMPKMIAGLAAAVPGTRPFQYQMQAPGGARLVDHVKAGRVAKALAEQRFDYVVLQEQQQWPSFGVEQRRREFEAPAGTLDVLARAAGAKTWLFLTWARRDGDLHNRPADSYDAMQDRVREGYRAAGRALGAAVVPVGLVWQRVVRSEPDLKLWDADGSHASRLGSYLAACVFFKAFYERSPEGNPFRAGLPEGEAARVQRAVAVGTALYAPSEL